MARISAFGFGNGILPDSAAGDSPGITTLTGTGTGNGFQTSGASQMVATLDCGAIAAATNEFILMCRMMAPVPSSNGRNFFGIQRVGVNDCLWFEDVDGSGLIRVGVNASPTVVTGALTELGTFSGFTFGVIHDVWIKWKSDPTTGVCEIRIDGATPTGWVDVTSADTQATSGTGLNRQLLLANSFSVARTIVGDILCMDDSGGAYNDFLSNAVSIYYKAANGSGIEDDWTGSDGNSVDNHLLVDDASPTSTTEHVESATATNRQIFDVEDLTEGGTIVGITATAHAVDSDAGNQAIDLGVRRSTSETTTSKTLSSTELSYSSHVWQDPSTAADWDDTGGDAARWISEVA